MGVVVECNLSLVIDGPAPRARLPLAAAPLFPWGPPASIHPPATLCPSRRGASPRALWWWTRCWRPTATPSRGRCSSATWCRAAPAPRRSWPRAAGGGGWGRLPVCCALLGLIVSLACNNVNNHPLSPACRYDTLLKQAWARQSALGGTVAPMPPLHATGLWHFGAASPRCRALAKNWYAVQAPRMFAARMRIARQPLSTPLRNLAGVTLNVDRLVHVAQASSRWRQPAGLPPGVRGGAEQKRARELP